jgi:hypothetical protein
MSRLFVAFFPFFQYDFSTGTYTPEGKIMQVVYAEAAVNRRAYVTTHQFVFVPFHCCTHAAIHFFRDVSYRSLLFARVPSCPRTTIGIHCKDGIIMGVEKVKISKMLCEGTNQQLFTVDRHAAVGVGGLVPDGRQIVNRAQHEANSYLKNYGEIISPEVLTERVATVTYFLHVIIKFILAIETIWAKCLDRTGCIYPKSCVCLSVWLSGCLAVPFAFFENEHIYVLTCL